MIDLLMGTEMFCTLIRKSLIEKGKPVVTRGPRHHLQVHGGEPERSEWFTGKAKGSYFEDSLAAIKTLWVAAYSL